MDSIGTMASDGERPDRVRQGGRSKAYRPLPHATRHAALAAALEAYERGDWFEAHELLEPAWMGTDDDAERELYQALIKLAAAYVHHVRGNPSGWRKSLENGRGRLASLVDGGPPDSATVGALLADVDRALREGPNAPPRRFPPLSELARAGDRG